MKNDVICDKKQRILFLSKTYEGSKHDKAIIEEEKWKLPKGIIVHEDSGFEGHNPPGVTIKRPSKKPKGKELTRRQKKSNRMKASQRVLVEHSIGRVKVYRIVKDCIRIWKEDAKDLVMDICRGIANFKL
ncbi:MAG: transposase family protein, partial [Chitinophagaceae bacterium]